MTEDNNPTELDAHAPHEQRVTAAKDGDQQLFDHIVLSDDDAGEVLAHLPVGLLELFDSLGVTRGEGGGGHARIGSGRLEVRNEKSGGDRATIAVP